MKKFMIFFLVVSISTNIYFLSRKIKHAARENEKNKLYFFKEISHKEGLDYFNKQIKSSYPETTIHNKYFIVYRWDSLLYDVMYREQMKALDSMATSFGKYQLEYVFVTEMEERASTEFLKRSNDEFKHVKMLYGMDDYISGLYSINSIKLIKPIVTRLKPSKTNEKEEKLNFKQSFLYLIMDSEGKVLFTNQNKCMVLKDTAFLNQLDVLLPDKNVKILN